VVAEVAAAALENKSCRHPMYDRQSLIVLGDHVTLDAGTGCVHTAPGHGREDYDVARRYGLEAYSPVDDNGCFTDEIDAFAGQYVFDANSAIKAHLSTIGALLKSERITHSYPHCWRCKQPVIFRATPQWFISMEKTGLREKSLAAIDQVHWIPRWGRERIYGMIENRPDWCVSRQRAWGVPITVFYCDDCESVYMTEAIMEKIHALFESHGADIWFEADIEKKLLPEGAACPQCGGKHLAKEDDILDVWFDSGVSHAAVLEARENLHWPADLYLEGSDQHRGWFHSALLTAVGTRGRAPYEAVLTHGFVVDSDGRKMSKSVGNVVAPGDVIKTYGAEVLRLWVTATDYRDDVRISEKILNQLSDAYRKIRNTCRFMLGNLSDFEPDKDRVDYAQLTEIDRFALHKLAGLVDRCRKAYDRYEFHTVYHALNHYCTVDLSAFYLDILKDRLYVTPPGDEARRAAQTVLYYTLENLVRIMAPILAFTAEELWAFVPGRKERDGSVHLQLFPEVQAQWRAAALAQKWAVLISVREEVAKALEEARVAKRIGHPLEAAVTINAGGDLFAQLKPYRNDLATIFITSQAELVSGQQLAEAYSSEQVAGLSVQVLPAIGAKCERCWMRAPSVGSHDDHPGLCNRCHGVIAGMEASPQQS
jgi:isoleucyl-tRNA synthetase